MMKATRVCTALVVVLLSIGSPVQARPKSKPGSTCLSSGMLKFDPQSHPSQRTNGMEVCSKYRTSTCCNATHAHSLRLKIREPVVAKFSSMCQALTEEMTCASCHPLMGTGEMKNVCPRLCDRWFNACKDEYYAYGGAGVLSPCYGNALVCSPLKEIAGSGAEFCVHMGFHVGSDVDIDGTDCFDGSVPEQLGEPEPTEPTQPWQVRLQRMLEEEAENPSGLFITGVLLLISMMLMGRRIMRQLGDPFGGDQPSLMEVRRLQQERYERGERMYDDETDSSSDEEFASRPAADQEDDEGGDNAPVSI
uniref:Folate receptor-like domain-containing protein n=1 Tax=Peronospora matthiolae TaxID=2874970 RepID=A0AAV1UKS1_9STRA